MYSKIIASALVIFGLLVISHSKVQEPSNLDQYYQCFTYAECDVGKSNPNSIFTCFNKLSGQELQPIFKYVNGTYAQYHTSSVAGAVQEYCDRMGQSKMDLFENTVNGIFRYQDMVCSKSMQEQCNSAETLLNCYLNLFMNLKQMGKC
ncbi:hypothetical protein HNY73_021609 [Argiope bruennichi]|uniref:Uncharacterized protein n=1 Tax=Argiope bruennichi TaxID=94029 RepID=A0A8T0DY55_ARGBR|nr:hypothetical protein HNY73_021609 [Argiope bruennichi]